MENRYKKTDLYRLIACWTTRFTYEELETEIKDLAVGYERKFLFQTDLKVDQSGTAMLSQDLVNQVSEGISVLNRLTAPHQSSLTVFKEKIYARYEEEEVPLCEVLDPDIGISFLTSSPGSGEIHPLIDDMQRGFQNQNTGGTAVNEIEIFLYNKFMEAIREEAIEVEITEEISMFREN